MGIGPPINPMTVERAQLISPGDSPYCAMMQIAAEDEYDDYVICRGYDPRIKKFIDYVAGDGDKVGIPVAKPWSNRVANAYTVGHMFPAVIPLTKIGQTPGVAATTQGQPADLDEEIGILKTTISEPYAEVIDVNWLLLDAGEGPFDRCICELAGAMLTIDATRTVDHVLPISGSSPLDDPTSTSETITAYNIHDWEANDAAIARIEWNRSANSYAGQWEFYQVDCPA